MAEDKKKAAGQKEVCMQAQRHKTGYCLRELQVPATGESRPHWVEKQAEARSLQAVHAM